MENTAEKLDFTQILKMPVSKRTLNNLKLFAPKLGTADMVKIGRFLKVLEFGVQKPAPKRMSMEDVITLSKKLVDAKGVSNVIRENSGKETANNLATKIAESLNQKLMERGVFWKLTKNDCIAEFNSLIKKRMVVLENNSKYILIDESPFAVLPQFQNDDDLL